MDDVDRNWLRFAGNGAVTLGLGVVEFILYNSSGDAKAYDARASQVHAKVTEIASKGQLTLDDLRSLETTINTLYADCPQDLKPINNYFDTVRELYHEEICLNPVILQRLADNTEIHMGNARPFYATTEGLTLAMVIVGSLALYYGKNAYQSFMRMVRREK